MHTSHTLIEHAHFATTCQNNQLYIGGQEILEGTIRITDSATVDVASLRSAWLQLPVKQPLAVLAFQASKEIRCLAHFFPLLRTCSDEIRSIFLRQLNALLQRPELSIVYISDAGSSSAPFVLRVLVTAEILCCFWKRPDVIDVLIHSKPSIHLFSNRALYIRAGGVGGGCYNADSHRIMLEAPRIFEGFFTPQPNVSPFLHEFGHMLDGTHMRSHQLPHCQGRLPHMDESHLQLWRRAKSTEYTLYMAWYHHRPPSHGQTPIGHPYVFQNDGEFLAGHWEMFWRNPHSMARMSPQLFNAFVAYTKQDPRLSLAEDYMGYVKDNLRFYQSGEQPWPSEMRYDIEQS